MNQLLPTTKLYLSILAIFFWGNNGWAQTDSCCVLEITRTILQGNDDVEESATGEMYMNSSDIELVNDGSNGNQIVGLRFTDIPIEQGVEIKEAYLQFTSDQATSTNFSDLNIAMEASDDATIFESTDFNVSNRSLTNASVDWIPESWAVPLQTTDKQKTPDLKALVQEIINRPNWASGNSVAFIFSGIGFRRAVAFETSPAQAAQLVITLEYPQADTLLENVFLNEIMPSNDLIQDEFGEADDWVEIYNGNNHPLFLGGLYLTDDSTDLQKWQITSTPALEPNGYGLVWADGTPEQGGLHADFKLKSSGEFLALVQEVNGTLHILDSLTFPAVATDISYGRVVDGASDWVFFVAPSPRSSNNGQGQLLDVDIQFSHTSGHYDAEVLLEISVTDPDVNIYYTLDGSEPTQQDILYENPILIEQTQLVSAKAFKSGFFSPAMQAELLIIDEAAEIGILNVQSDPDNFWDDQTGIYVSGTNGGLDYCNDELHNWNQEWERPCQLTFLEPDGTVGFNVNAGMKIGGACSKNLKMKSLNFFLRSNAYGDELIDYQIFPHQDITEYRRIKIRNGGSDWQEMLFRDGMNHTILANTVDIDLMAYRPVRVYLNGQYWGIYGLREMFNKHYIASHHGVDDDNIDLLGDPYGPRSTVRDGDDERYNELVDFINNNSLTIASNYETIREFIDVQEYINYHIAQIYLANYDWPGNNVRVWRDKNNGKFRWMLFDTDASTGWISWGNDVGKHFHNTLAHTMNTAPVNMFVPGFTEWPNGAESTYLFRKMMDSDSFQDEFVQRTCTFRELIFAPDRVIPMVDSVENLLEPEMLKHVVTWLGNSQFGSGSPSGGSVFSWQLRVSDFKSFYEQRYNSILSIYASTLGLADRFDLTFGYDETTTGNIVIHENEMAVPFNYQGAYFKNVPIKIRAIPDNGYYFSHWLETGNPNAEINFVGNADQTLTPVFTDQPVSTEDLELDFRINIYPNPVEEILTIDLLDLENEAALTVFDIYGKVLLQKDVFEKNTTIAMSEFPAGIYLVVIDTERGSIGKRIVKN
ncbi:MAG: CotH kinase family protein [Bacteroidota bacterium]